MPLTQSLVSIDEEYIQASIPIIEKPLIIGKPQTPKQRMKTVKAPCGLHGKCSVKLFKCQCALEDPKIIHPGHDKYDGTCAKCLSYALESSSFGRRIDNKHPEAMKHIGEFKRHLLRIVPDMLNSDILRLERFLTGQVTPGIIGMIGARFGCVIRNLISEYHLLMRHTNIDYST